MLGQHLLNTASPRFAAYTERISRVYWSDGLNTTEKAVVRDVAGKAGVTAAELSSAEAAMPALGAELSTTQAWCKEAGVLGVPFFIVCEQRFWRSDRFAALLRHLADIGCGPFSAELARNLL